MYIGPLTQAAALMTVNTDPDARVSSVLMDNISKAATVLASQPADDLSWEQYSRKLNRMSAVDGGFVGNRFDTQRRRGEKETIRQIWT